MLGSCVSVCVCSGVYTVLYDGEGELSFGFDSKVVGRDKGRVLVQLTPTSNPPCDATFAAYCGDNGMWMEVTAINPSNPIRNIRVYMPGTEPGTRFHPYFVKSLEQYSTLRFMDWMVRLTW